MRGLLGKSSGRARLPLGIAIMGAAMILIGTASFARGADASAPPDHLRNVVVRSLFPVFGVELTVDGSAPRAVNLGDTLPFDHRAHRLEFSCAHDLCEPFAEAIKPGTSDEDLQVALAIRPARLQIEGNLAHRFVVREEPALGCGCAAVPMIVPLHSGQRVVHVTDVDTKQTVTVTLIAGKTTVVSFF